MLVLSECLKKFIDTCKFIEVSKHLSSFQLVYSVDPQKLNFLEKADNVEIFLMLRDEYLDILIYKDGKDFLETWCSDDDDDCLYLKDVMTGILNVLS